MADPGLTPRRGMRFEHARFRRYVPGKKIADCPPDIGKVTRVTSLEVFYRMSDGEGPLYARSPATFHEIVGRVLT